LQHNPYSQEKQEEYKRRMAPARKRRVHLTGIINTPEAIDRIEKMQQKKKIKGVA